MSSFAFATLCAKKLNPRDAVAKSHSQLKLITSNFNCHNVASLQLPHAASASSN